MSETQAAPEAKSDKIPVTMEDGRVVEFPPSRKIASDILFDDSGNPCGVRFDFFNGATRQFLTADANDFIRAYLAAHGASQKIRDEWAGTLKKGGTLEDVVLECEAMIERLSGENGRWDAERSGGGDSMAGASLIIKALIEVTGKDQGFVKKFLEDLLEEGKTQGLTRQKLYASFRDPTSEVGRVVRRLEEEKATANAAFKGDDLVARLRAKAA